MERLRWHDLQTFLTSLPELYAQQDLDGFPAHILSILRKLVPAGHLSYNQVNLRTQRVSVVIEPPDTYFPSDSPEA